MLPCTAKLSDLKFRPVGLILGGGPYSVYDEGAPHVDPAFLDLNIPILGICYGLQELAYRLDSQNVVAGGAHREYGMAELNAKSINAHTDRLFQGIESSMKVWMSHGDKLGKLPEGFHTIAATKNSEYAAIAHDTQPIYGIQFHPEVTHTPNGTQLLKNFAIDICGVSPDWTMGNFVEQEIGRIRKLVGNGRVLGAVSGGVDSTVAAKLMHEAIGHRFTAVLVDHGYLRHQEREQVEKDLNVGVLQDWTVYEAAAILLTLRRSTSASTSGSWTHPRSSTPASRVSRTQKRRGSSSEVPSSTRSKRRYVVVGTRKP
jgi:GMP synthase (glutamine-hydrolysing)